jgi:hypothetical protein
MTHKGNGTLGGTQPLPYIPPKYKTVIKPRKKKHSGFISGHFPILFASVIVTAAWPLVFIGAYELISDWGFLNELMQAAISR